MRILLFCFLFSLMVDCYSQPNQPLTILLDWFANPNHAPLFVAEQEGFFKEQGLDVSLLGPADPSDPPKLVAAGKADMAITYEPHFIDQVAHGLPLVRIATLIDKPLSCLVVLKNSPIHHLSDLKNKRIGYSGGSMTQLSLNAMLTSNHVNLNQVELINVHYNLTQALLSKKVDAVTGIMRNFELIQLELVGQPGKAFFPEENGIPTYSELIFVVHEKNKDDPRFKLFLTALQKGIDYLKKNPERSWNQFAKNHPALNNELNKRAWFITLPYFADRPCQFDQEKYVRFKEFMLHKEEG